MPKVDRRSHGDFRPLRWLDAIVRRLDVLAMVDLEHRVTPVVHRARRRHFLSIYWCQDAARLKPESYELGLADISHLTS
jgi:hypothetical protein